ncbi:MAG: DUF2026 family protein [Methylococcales bacterium]
MDFQRIFQTIHGALLAMGLNTKKSCVAFNVIGAAILRVHYGLSAYPKIGMAAYNLDNMNEVVLVFANEINANTQNGKMPFHCWVQVDNWFVDFSSPIFPEILSASGMINGCRRKMFQKPLIEASVSISELNDTGAFYCLSDQLLSRETITNLSNEAFFIYLTNMCLDWYKRPPRKMMSSIGIKNREGIPKKAFRSSITVNGFW